MFFFQKPDIDQSVLSHQAKIIKNSKPNESDIYRGLENNSELQNYMSYFYTDPVTGEKAEKKLYSSLDCFYNGMEINGENHRFLGRRVNNEYQWTTYKDTVDAVLNLGSAFVNMYGIKTKSEFESTVGIFMINCPEWIYADYACLSYSIVSTPLYSSFDDDSLIYIINNTNVRLVLTHYGNLDKLLRICGRNEILKHIIVCDYGMESIPEEKLNTANELGVSLRLIGEVLEFGKQNRCEPVPIKGEDVFTVCYTSGTTGAPKGVVLKNQSPVASINGFLAKSNYIIKKGHVHMSYLPLAHIFERIVSHGFLGYGAVLGFFSGNARNLVSDLGLLKPNDLPTVPRVLCRIYDNVIQNVKKAGFIQRLIFNFALERKRSLIKRGIISKNTIWDRLVFNKIQGIVGGELVFIISGSAPIDHNIIEFMRITLGCQIFEGYGQTETSGCSNIQIYGDYQYLYGSNVGSPTINNEIKLVDVPEMDYLTSDEPNPRGEICSRGYNSFVEYLNNPTATKETKDEDGWVHSGDIGEILPNGTLKIIDRKKNIFKLAQGEYIAPEKVETRINNSKYIMQSFVDGNPLSSKLVAIIVPDVENVVPMIKGSNDDTEWTLEKVCQSESARQLILQNIDTVAREYGLNGFEIPKEIYLSSTPFSIENGLLTPTFKNKRIQIKRYYSDIIESMYQKLDS